MHEFGFYVESGVSFYDSRSCSLTLFIFVCGCCSVFMHLLFYKQTFCQSQTNSYHLWNGFRDKIISFAYVYFKIGYPMCARVCLLSSINFCYFFPLFRVLFWFLLNKNTSSMAVRSSLLLKWFNTIFRLSYSKSIKLNETDTASVVAWGMSVSGVRTREHSHTRAKKN